MPSQSNNPYGYNGYTASYNTTRLSHRFGVDPPKIIIAILLLVVALIASIAGYWYYKGQESRLITKLGKEYVGYIVKGENDKAYVLSAQTIKESRTAQQYDSSMSNLKTPLPYYAQPQKVIFTDKSAHFYMRVDNLPPTSSGRTDGIFALTFTKDKSWKVSGVSVQ